jgi:hypothetical protein
MKIIVSANLYSILQMKSFVYMGRVCTASEMHQHGFMVTEVLWDSRYQEQLASKLQNVNANEYTKSIYKTYCSSKNTKQLGIDLALELNTVESFWMSDRWQKSIVQQLNRDRYN